MHGFDEKWAGQIFHMHVLHAGYVYGPTNLQTLLPTPMLLLVGTYYYPIVNKKITRSQHLGT